MRSAALATAAIFWAVTGAPLRAPAAPPTATRPGVIQLVAGRFRARQEPIAPVQPVQPVQPIQPIQPIQPVSQSGGDSTISSLLGSFSNVDNLTNAQQQRTVSVAPAASAISGQESLILATTDAGNLLTKSDSATGVSAFRRQVAADPRIRGFRNMQIYTQLDGGWWQPARPDLDTIVSQIDSGIIEDIVILKGPYSALYGPAFSYLDVVTNPTPRYCNGFHWGGRTGLIYQTNGQQWYGRQVFWGGASDYGFRIGYGQRAGSDYESGDNIEIPASYKLRDIDLAYGLDLSPTSRVELHGLRLDGTDIEYFGQLTDTDLIVTDGVSLRYIDTYQPSYDRWIVEGWYNNTRGNGSSAREENNPGFINTFGDDFSLFTDFRVMTTGVRSAWSWGDVDSNMLTVGADFRYMKQNINEYDIFEGVIVVPFFTDGQRFDLGGVTSLFGLPESHWSDPGLFAETQLLLTERWRVKVGGRIDWISANSAPLPSGFPFDQTLIWPVPLDQSFTLGSGYVTNEYDLSPTWTAHLGGGYAERAPALLELYALAPFIATIQQGTRYIFGNPDLAKERLLQVDAGLSCNYSNLRGGVNFFYGWVNDYITYDLIDPVLGGLQTINTERAILAGGECYGEWDLTDRWTPFASVSYVEGYDQIIDTPLPSIYPLQSRLGVRLHPAGTQQPWGIELSTRVVDNQDRVASNLLELPTAGFTVWDLRGYYQGPRGWLLTGGVENFTDKQYFEHFDLRTFGLPAFQPGVNFFTGIERRY